MLKQLTDETFKREIEEDVPVIVGLWESGCEICKKLGIILQEIEIELENRVKITSLNIDENEETAAKFGVFSIPTILIFRNGQVAAQSVGLKPKQAILSWIKNYI